jgi:hypothetical protein
MGDLPAQSPALAAAWCLPLIGESMKLNIFGAAQTQRGAEEKGRGWWLYG